MDVYGVFVCVEMMVVMKNKYLICRRGFMGARMST